MNSAAILPTLARLVRTRPREPGEKYQKIDWVKFYRAVPKAKAAVKKVVRVIIVKVAVKTIAVGTAFTAQKTLFEGMLCIFSGLQLKLEYPNC